MTRIRHALVHLLDDLGQSQLAGDLTEELHAGRSHAWWWWQVSAGVLRGLWSSMRENPYLTFRAIAVGWITLQILDGRLPFSPHLEIGAWIHQSPVWMVLVAAQYAVVGWVVARLHPRHRTALVLAAGSFLMVTSFIWTAYVAVLVSQMQSSPRLFPSGLALVPWCIFTGFALLLPAMSIVGGLWGSVWSPDKTAPRE